MGGKYMKQLFCKITAIALSAALILCSFCFLTAGAAENTDPKPFVIKTSSNLFPGEKASYYDISQFEDESGNVYLTLEFKMHAANKYLVNLNVKEVLWDPAVLEFKESYNTVVIGRNPVLNIIAFGIEQGLGGGIINTFGDNNGGRLVGNFTAVSPAAYAYNGDKAPITVVKLIFRLLNPEALETTVTCTMQTMNLCDDTELQPYSQYNIVKKGVVNEEYASLASFSTVISPGAQYQTGDLDGDGSVTIKDVTALQGVLAEFNSLDLSDPAVFAAADINRDGKVNIRDVTQAQRYLAGFITEL